MAAKPARNIQNFLPRFQPKHTFQKISLQPRQFRRDGIPPHVDERATKEAFVPGAVHFCTREGKEAGREFLVYCSVWPPCSGAKESTKTRSLSIKVRNDCPSIRSERREFRRSNLRKSGAFHWMTVVFSLARKEAVRGRPQSTPSSPTIAPGPNSLRGKSPVGRRRKASTLPLRTSKVKVGWSFSEKTSSPAA